jgi:PAS domain S-box-containing protein
MRQWFPRVSSLTLALAAGTTVAVGAAGVAGAYLYSARHSESLLESAREMARTQGELIQAALEHQMMEDDRTLIAQMIETFGRQPNIERVVLLDRKGTPQFSSVPIDKAAADFTPGSPTCRVCHEMPAAARDTSRVLDTQGGTVLRTVIPVRNQPKCQQCHDPSHRINGVLMLDLNTEAIRAGMDRDLRRMVFGTGVLTLALITGIAVLIRVVVLRRLQKFETAARAIAAGDLARRVPSRGSDTISWLAREFNTMADSMTNLVGEVQGQQQRLETIINSIDDGIVVLDPDRTIVAANRAFVARTGDVRAHVLGCGCRQAGVPGVCGVGDCPTLACLGSKARQVRICERRRPDGQTAWEEVHASPVLGSSGEVRLVVEVWRDISDRRTAEARLAESHRLASLGLLASGFSHELNTPLATVLTCVEGILRDAGEAVTDADRSYVQESASIAREQLLRCRGITQHFLRLARGHASPVELIDIAAGLEAAVRLVQPTARAHGVQLTLAGPLPAVHARAVDAELQHVVINLVLNAIQASAPGGRVELGLAPGDPVRIVVRDHGCGIAPEQHARIFEPFFSARPGGTGLGLFLSLTFVRQWGGDLSVSSEPGRGSTFEIRLPAAAGEATRASA